MTQPQYGYAPQQPGGYQTYDPNQQQYPPQTPPVPQAYGQYQPQAPQQFPPAGYVPVPNGYAPPGYAPQGYGQPPVPQGPPLANGTLEDFYGQPSLGGGKGISWKSVPDGFTVWGVVSRPIGNGDVFQDTDPMTKQPRFFRDGRPKLSMQVPLKLLVPIPGYTDGEARLFLRGQLRDETTRAMQEAGAQEGPPEAGAFMAVTLTHRKPGNNIAQNIFAVIYRSPGTWENDPNLHQQLAQYGQQPMQQQAPVYGAPYGGAPQQAPYQQQAPAAQYGQPAQAAPNPQQYAAGPQAPVPAQQPQYGQQAYDPNQQYGQPPATMQAPAGAVNAGGQAAYSNPQQAPAPQDAGQYAQQLAMQADSNQVQGQQQLPYQQQAVQPPAQPPAPPQGPPVQPGVQQSALPPEKQALLARMQNQQQAPQQG